MRPALLAVFGVVLFGSAVRPAGSTTAPGAPDVSGFPSCVAGTYLGEVTLTELGFTFRSLNTLGADGTYVTESTVDFGGGGAVPNAFRTGGRGAWRMSGPHSVRVTYLHFAFDSIGALLWLEKVDATLRFTRSCASVAGQATSSIYLPQQDPFGDDPPVAGATASLVLKRMPVD